MTSAQVNILLLCLGALQGIFLFILLFKKRHSLPGYIFLAGYLTVMLLQITMKLASKLWLMQTIDPLYKLSYQLPFLYGPLAWLFVSSITGQRKLSKKDTLHFLPALIVIGSYIFSNPNRYVPVIFWPLFHTLYAMIFQLISLVVYHGMAFYQLKKYKDHLTSPAANSIRFRIAWLRQFIIASFIVCSAIAIIMCGMYYHFPHWQNIRFGFAALTIFIYWISYKAWSQPELFSVIRGYSNEAADHYVVPKLTVHLPAKKYSNSGLDEDEMKQIIIALEHKMKVDKLYSDPELTIDMLAESLSCRRHHLSQAMNDKLGKSFYDYVNFYRVEEVKKLLADHSKDNHKIASLAYDAGFNSISTFNDVFKKITGYTPSQYRKQRDEKELQKQRV